MSAQGLKGLGLNSRSREPTWVAGSIQGPGRLSAGGNQLMSCSLSLPLFSLPSSHSLKSMENISLGEDKTNKTADSGPEVLSWIWSLGYKVKRHIKWWEVACPCQLLGTTQKLFRTSVSSPQTWKLEPRDPRGLQAVLTPSSSDAAAQYLEIVLLGGSLESALAFVTLNHWLSFLFFSSH